jgi:DNA-binding CsgD family transcriptional regulator
LGYARSDLAVRITRLPESPKPRMDAIAPKPQDLSPLAHTLLRIFDRMHCGLLLLDDKKRIIASNKCAGALIGESLLIKHDRPCASHRTSDALFQMILDQTIKYRETQTDWRREAVALRREAGCPLIARVVSVESAAVSELGGAAVAIVVVDPDECITPSLPMLEQAFGLTPAEARIAKRLLCAKSLNEIAEEFSVTVGTVRSQLKSIFAKTHTHRQSELVALLTRLAMITEDDQSFDRLTTSLTGFRADGTRAAVSEG